MRGANETELRRAPAQPIDGTDLLVAFALVALAVSLAAWSLLDRNVTLDDGFYYLKIARQIASGAGSTFDGVHPTNGYHPLWLGILAALAAVTPEASMLRVAVLLQAGLWGAASAMVYLTSREWFGRIAAGFGAVAWLELTTRVALTGVEFSLHAFCFATTAYVYARLESRDYGGFGIHLALGIATAAMVLARLETIVLAVLLAGFLVDRERRRGLPLGAWRRIAAFAAPVLAVSLAYALVNEAAFGHVAPVSGAVKRAWSLELLRADPHYRAGGWLTAKAYHVGAVLLFSLKQRKVLIAGTAGALLALGLAARLRARHPGVGSFVDVLRPFVIYGTVQLCLCMLVYHGDLSVSAWYFVAPPWVAAMLAGAAFGLAFRAAAGRARRLASPLLAAAWCALLVILFVRVKNDGARLDPDRDPLIRGAAWARANLPEGATIGAWNAGTLGYLSGRRVVNLDGVVNSWDFFLHERGDLCSYFERNRITYLVDDFGDSGAFSTVPTFPTYAACANRLERLATITNVGRDGRVEAYRVR